jgi:hypothetical protein
VVAHHFWDRPGGGELVMAGIAAAAEKMGLTPVLTSLTRFDGSRYREWFGIDLSRYPAISGRLSPTCKERQSRKKPQRRRGEEYGVWNIRHYGLYNPSLYIGKKHYGKEVYHRIGNSFNNSPASIGVCRE